MRSQIEEIEKIASAPDFWNDMERSKKLLTELQAHKNKVSEFEKLTEQYDDVLTLVELGISENDDSVTGECKKLFQKFTDKYEDMMTAALLCGEYDKLNAMVSLHAGTGGTEACDWVSMLFRMYSRWAASKGYSVEVLDYLDGDSAGTKSVTFQVSGENAYGYLRSEHGVHRLVRISPFDSSGKRHTSFASCDVMPELNEDIEFEIAAEEIRIDTYRASGAGGQHVNKTESAIRITHIPTGTVVQCQNERSQHKNRDRAMQMLKSKLYKLKQDEQAEKAQGIRGETKDIAWGSQIRSYVFCPYNLVKDHRTNAEATNLQAVMDGGIDVFITAYLSDMKS